MLNAIGDEQKMIEEFEYKGEWWLPDNPDRRISGTLKFTPNGGAVLDLIGSFKDFGDITKTEEPDIILGISANREITLYKCFQTKSTLSSSGFYTSVLCVNVVFIGAYFQKSEDIKFKNLSIHYAYLDEWVNISGFNIPFSVKKEILIKYKLPKPIQVTVSDGLKISVYIRAIFPGISIVQKEACIKQKAYIEIEPSKEKSFKEYLKIIYCIQNFLSLAVIEPVYPLIIEGKTEINKVVIEKGKIHYPPVSIFYQLPTIPDVSKKLMPNDMLFTFGDISKQFKFFLTNWVKNTERLESVYDLYFGTLYNPQMYLQYQFLSLIQAVESYHRRTMQNYELSENKHKEKITEILDTVPRRYKKWLEWKLKYSNEPILKQRLEDILQIYSEVLTGFINDKESFVNKTTITRNYLTHYDSNLKEKSARGEELYYLTQKLKGLIGVCLLKETGFDFSNIKNLISRSRKYQYRFKI